MRTNSLIGKYFKADHPIAIVNPKEYNKIVDVKFEWSGGLKVYVLGEYTCWFNSTLILDIVDEVDQ